MNTRLLAALREGTADTQPGSPPVSIVTPSYNQRAWLGENLRSVAEQRYPDLEHIVMDGGSTDGSVELLEREASSVVRWESEPDRGQSHALNKAFERAHGEIIGWLNSDDAFFDPFVVADVVDAFLEHPDVDVVYGHAALVNSEGLVLQLLWVPAWYQRITEPLWRIHPFLVQPAVFVRRRAIGEQLVDERFEYTMDRELWLRLSRRHRFLRLGRVLAVDRHYMARKSLTLLEARDRDRTRLDTMYGLPKGSMVAPARKALKILVRLAGLTLVPAAARAPSLSAHVDSPLRLAARQLLFLRRWMPDPTLRAWE